MKSKTIFIYVNQGFSVRYLLRSSVLKNLVNTDVSLRVVILSHNGNEKVFRDNFVDKNIEVEKFENEKFENFLKNNRLQRFLIKFRSFTLNGNYNTRTIDDFRNIFLEEKGWKKRNDLKGYLTGLLWELATFLLKKIKIFRKLLIKFESVFLSPTFHEHLFKKYSPDLVVVTALCGFKYNELFARESKKFKVPVCCVVLSWDNTSGMGMRGYSPDYIIAWTEIMKEELIQLNDIDKRKIFVGGVAHFDPYYSNEILLPKETLFNRLGLDLNKKIIFYATKSPKRFPWGPKLVARLAKAIAEKKINVDAQILVRIHPLHYRTKNNKLIFQNILDEYDEVANKYTSVILNKPSTVSTKIDFDMPNSETGIVSSILKHSDIMLNMFSTMVIEAAIYDLPSINVCIRELCKADYGKSKQDIMVDYLQTHNQRLIQTGGVKTVFTMEDLFKSIDEYLIHPQLESKGRKLIVNNEAGPFRGNSGKMIAKYVKSLVQ